MQKLAILFYYYQNLHQFCWVFLFLLQLLYSNRDFSPPCLLQAALLFFQCPPPPTYCTPFLFKTWDSLWLSFLISNWYPRHALPFPITISKKFLNPSLQMLILASFSQAINAYFCNILVLLNHSDNITRA